MAVAVNAARMLLRALEVSTALKLGFELIATRPTPIRLGTFFETWIATSTGTVRRSLGRDEYHLSLTIGSSRRLAATGRTHICQFDLEAADLGVNQARPPVLAETEIPPGAPTIWSIRTNLFLDLTSLSTGTTARLITPHGMPIGFGLDNALLMAEEVAPGRYILDVGGLILDAMRCE